ncbi:hypothetical protein JCM10212_001663 [Sporobolomyces blumeae]
MVAPLHDSGAARPADASEADPNAMVDPPTPPSPQLKFPWNYLHVVSQFLILLALLPYHATLFSVFPSKRPRPTWTLLEAVFQPAVKRYLAMIDTAGFKISARDIESEPGPIRCYMSGCRFEWFESQVDKDLVTGEIDDPWMGMRDRIAVFSWYRRRKSENVERTREGFDEAERRGDLVGLFFHGGAFTHNSAHPKSQSTGSSPIVGLFPRKARPTHLAAFARTVMPMTLFEREKRFVSMHSVEFRLLPDSPYPAALQDAVSAFVHLLKRGVPAHHIVLIGDSSGANLALALARWIRDTRSAATGGERTCVRDGKETKWKLEDPAGLVLFSPWVDPSHSFLNCKPGDYVRRDNSCDYILEEGPFRHHLVHNLLGRHPRNLVLSPYLSPGRVGVPPGTFIDFPPCYVAYGTGERGQAEDERLIGYLERDGVECDVVRRDDTPHDVLLLGFWGKDHREAMWQGALKFLNKIPNDDQAPHSMAV